MMAAAQAAAEAAILEAAAREAGSTAATTTTTEHNDAVANLLMQEALQQGNLEQADAAQQLLHEMMAIQTSEQGGAAGEDMEALLKMMEQQVNHQGGEQMEPAVPQRPTEHYMTVADDGTILEATLTVTGFPPEALLMTSWYDSVYKDDMPGFKVIKQQFWARDKPDVPAYLRRRTLEGDWLWVSTKVVSYMNDPVPGIIVEERIVEDEDFAIQVNRITRITAILMNSVETAREREQKEAAKRILENANLPHHLNLMDQQIPFVGDDALAYQKWLQEASGQPGVGISSTSHPLQAIMQTALSGGTQAMKQEEVDSDDPIVRLRHELMKGEDTEERKGFDPLSALKEVRGEGIRLDMGMIALAGVEMRLVSLVLTGVLKVEELGDLAYAAINTPNQSLASILEMVSPARRERHDQPGMPDSDRQRKSSNRSRSRAKPGSSHSSRKDQMRGGNVRTNSFHEHSSSPRDILDHHSPYRRQRSAPSHSTPLNQLPYEPQEKLQPAPICVLNLSYTYMGNEGMDELAEFIYMDGSQLETLDISFCSLDEKGILSLARALAKRKRRGGVPLKGLLLAGNTITYRAARDLGMALAVGIEEGTKSRKRPKKVSKAGGYDEDTESDDDDIDDDDGDDFSVKSSSSSRKRPAVVKGPCCSKDRGLQILHLGLTSLTPESLYQLLQGLGPHCPVREISLPSNNIGPTGASMLVEFLDSKGSPNHVTMPFLDRLDLSNNELGDDGTARLTRAVAKRAKHPFVDLRLSNNSIGHGGIETIMNKLLQHNIISLSLDKNYIGDQGCQLVAASLPSMHSLSRLNLNFNQIGSRGIQTLMKTLIGCESITYLGLSGNIMKIAGAIAMGFTLAQHPRLEELDMDNCCLSQSAQCHITSGIISNRWVPMKFLHGFQAGPPMAAIGAIGMFAHNLSNEDCFRNKRDEQMKTILQWMESNRAARQNQRDAMDTGASYQSDNSAQYLTPDFVSTINEVKGAPSQNAYLRMLGWLSKIPFDEDELTMLRMYFYDADGGEGDRGSDGYINLKLRGDLLAALDSGIADEIRDHEPLYDTDYNNGSVGFDLEKLDALPGATNWDSLRGNFVDIMPEPKKENFDTSLRERTGSVADDSSRGDNLPGDIPHDVAMESRKRNCSELSEANSGTNSNNGNNEPQGHASTLKLMEAIDTRGSLSSLSRQSLHRSESERSIQSTMSSSARGRKPKPRITMFPQFEAKLEDLKNTAKDMMDSETDPDQQEIILTQYAEASLTILRQLRYHCMNSGLDGWRQAGLRRKVLIVDDSLVTRKMVARAFEKANFIVDTAENGVEGVKKMKASIYDIAFMDIDMPVMNGFEATKALRQWEDSQRPGARQPICALTAAYVDDFARSELMKFKEAGLDVMESKPCNIPRLFKVVDDVSPMFSDLSISISQGSFNSA